MMAVKKIPVEYQEAATQRDKKIKDTDNSKVTPIWLYTGDDDREKIDVIKLANCIVTDNPMVNNKFSENGYWYDNKNGYWLTNTDTHLEKIIADSMLSVGKWQPNTFSSVKKLVTIKTTSEADYNPFDHNNPYLVSFKNGTYNIQDGTTKENSASDYILQGHNYNLDINGDAPITNKWFIESFGSKEAANVVKAYIGYMFARTYGSFQKFMIFFGSGGDGKSTILNYLITLIGANNTSNVSLADIVGNNDKFATSQLYQKDMNYCADIGNKFIDETADLKNITGGDRSSAQFKNKDRFDFWNHAKLIFSANRLPAFNDFSDGFLRRPIIVEVHKIKDFNDKYSMDDIKKERGAFAYQCMHIFKMLLDDKYPGKLDKWGFPTTDKMKAALKKWVTDNDMVSRWLDERCDTSNPAAFEKSVYVYENYKRFCTSEGGHPLGKKNFNANLSKHNITPNAQKKIDGKKYRGYKGIRLLND